MTKEELEIKVEMLIRENARLKEELQQMREILQYQAWQSVKGNPLI
jgi:chaperonin cofactor prefoldin